MNLAAETTVYFILMLTQHFIHKFAAYTSIIPTTTDIFNIHANDNINISCTLMEVESPTPYSITWKYKGRSTDKISHDVFIQATQQYSTSPSFAIRSIYNRVVSTIMIIEASYSDDDGSYTCKGTNSFGTTYATIIVRVRGKGIVSYETDNSSKMLLLFQDKSSILNTAF